MSLHPNAQLIERFYTAFQKRDGATMASLYHPEATFSDPAFQSLRGPQVGAMWQMLCARGTDLVVRFSNVQADDQKGSAHWDASYTFSATGRHVHNWIDASFEFKDGRIVKHIDRFDFPRWLGMALGPVGMLLGWTPMLQKKVRAQAMKGLESYMQKNGL